MNEHFKEPLTRRENKDFQKQGCLALVDNSQTSPDNALPGHVQFPYDDNVRFILLCCKLTPAPFSVQNGPKNWENRPIS